MGLFHSFHLSFIPFDCLAVRHVLPCFTFFFFLAGGKCFFFFFLFFFFVWLDKLLSEHNKNCFFLCYSIIKAPKYIAYGGKKHKGLAKTCKLNVRVMCGVDVTALFCRMSFYVHTHISSSWISFTLKLQPQAPERDPLKCLQLSD